MNDSGFLNEDISFESIEKLETQGGTSESFIVKINGKSFFMKRMRAEHAGNPKIHCIFEKEFEIGSSLSTPYIPKYISLNKKNGDTYILMEYVLGENIEEKLKNDPKYFHNEKNVQKLLIQLLEGLQELHKKDIIYLDTSPKNIMLTKFGYNVKIIDLGFCANAAYHRTAGSTVGFQAPEVKDKHWDEIDAKSDIYSVGLLLRYIKENSGAKYSRRLNSFMQHCMNKNKNQRFANCGEAIEALKNPHKWKLPATVVALCSGVAVVCATMMMPGKTSITLSGVEYAILSQEELTCIVIGGEGIGHNIYIDPTITIGDKIYKTVAINDSAFNRSRILSVDIPEGIETIGQGAFHDCDSIITLNLPSTIKEFNGAFIRMSNTRRISLPPVKKVCTAAFVENSSLESIIIPEGTEYICRDAFVSCISLKNVSLPQSLRVLERGVFYNCQTLEKITIPAQVTEIGDYAFFECKNLRCIYCYAMIPPRITAITNTANVTVFVPEAALDNYKKDFNWGEYNIQPMPRE